MTFDAGAVLKWWMSMQPDTRTGRRGDAGARAELRRCGRAAEVHLVPAFELLVRALPRANPEDLAVVAAILAHAREHDPSAPVAEQIARPTAKGDAPPVSPQRFRRLLQVEGRDQRIAAGTRLLRQMGGRLNLTDLASSFYWWDASPDDVHRRWARRYYGALPADLMKKSEG